MLPSRATAVVDVVAGALSDRVGVEGEEPAAATAAPRASAAKRRHRTKGTDRADFRVVASARAMRQLSPLARPWNPVTPCFGWIIQAELRLRATAERRSIGLPWPGAGRPPTRERRFPGRSLPPSHGSGCRRGPIRLASAAPCARCCRGSGPWHGGRSVGKRRRKRSPRRWRGWRPMGSGVRAHGPRVPEFGLPIVPSISSKLLPTAVRTSMLSMIVLRKNSGRKRGGHSSGPGTVGGSSQIPEISSSSVPRAALTVRISSPSTRPIARPCVTWPPTAASVTSQRSSAPLSAYERYCAVAQTVGRPEAASSATSAAPKSASAEEEIARRRQLGSDVHAPVQLVAVGFHPEEGSCVHGAAP